MLRQILFYGSLNPVGETRVLHQAGVVKLRARAVHVVLEAIHDAALG